MSQHVCMKKRYLAFSIIIFISLQLGCSEQKAFKVLLIGIDGATFSVINPMLKQGQLPQFKKLIDNGAHGILKSQNPMFSPIIWTSIVTGKTPQVHGIDGVVFNEKFQENYSSNNRKVQALWNIVGSFGKTVGFAGWWASWPAESVNGWIISDWITLNGYGHWSTKQEIITEHLTYPPSLVNESRPFNVNPVQPPLDEIRELAEFSAEEMSELEVAQQPMLGHPLSILKFGYCTQRANEEMALYMLKKHPPDLTGIFLIAVDQVSHTFWHYYEPWKYAGVDHEKAVRLGHVIPNIYVHDDQYIARLLRMLIRVPW